MTYKDLWIVRHLPLMVSSGRLCQREGWQPGRENLTADDATYHPLKIVLHTTLQMKNLKWRHLDGVFQAKN